MLTFLYSEPVQSLSDGGSQTKTYGGRGATGQTERSETALAAYFSWKKQIQ